MAANGYSLDPWADGCFRAGHSVKAGIRSCLGSNCPLGLCDSTHQAWPSASLNNSVNVFY